MVFLLSLLFVVLVVTPTFLWGGGYIGHSNIGSVKGVVYDGLTASRLVGVKIEMPRRSPLYTNHEGLFKIDNLPIGINHLVFRLKGYVPQEEVFVIYEDEEVYLSIFMWPMPIVDKIPLLPPGYRSSRPAPDWRYDWYLHCPYCHWRRGYCCPFWRCPYPLYRYW